VAESQAQRSASVAAEPKRIDLKFLIIFKNFLLLMNE